MLIYYFLVIYIFVLNTLMLRGRITRKQCVGWTAVAFIIITGLRHNMVGSDTTVYYLAFFANRYRSIESVLAHRDIGFYLLSWIVQNITGSFEILTLTVACLFYIPMAKLIYNYSDDPCLSWLTLMAFNFFQFSMTGMRQTVAFGFVLIAILELLKEDRNISKAVIIILIGTTFHLSCLTALLYIVLTSKKVTDNKLLKLYLLILIPITFVFRGTIVHYLQVLSGDIGYKYEFSEGGGGLVTYIVYVLITFIGLTFLHQYTEKYGNKANVDLTIVVIATALQSTVMVSSVMFRVAWYFAIWLVIYLPRLKNCFVKGDSYLDIVADIIMYGAVLFMFFGITIGSAFTENYMFFWEGA